MYMNFDSGNILSNLSSQDQLMTVPWVLTPNFLSLGLIGLSGVKKPTKGYSKYICFVSGWGESLSNDLVISVVKPR